MKKLTRQQQVSLFIVTILTFVVVYFLYNELRGREAELERALYHLNPWWLLGGVAMMLLAFVFEALVTKVLLGRLGAKKSWLSFLRVPLMNALGTGVTPFATGGQPAQLLALNKVGIETGRAMSVLLMKFLIYQVAIVIAFAGVYLIGERYVYENISPEFATLVPFAVIIHAVVIGGILLFMYWPALSHRIIRVLAPLFYLLLPNHTADKWLAIANEKVDNFHDESRRMAGSGKSVLFGTVLTLVQLAVFYTIPYFVIRAFGYADVNVVLILVMHIMIVMVISLFPIPGGVGGAELSFQLLFTPFVPNGASLLLVILFWRLITYYLGLFAGLVAWIWPTKIKKE
jgi:uncharacterized protein (TIRG00374 family)